MGDNIILPLLAGNNLEREAVQRHLIAISCRALLRWEKLLIAKQRVGATRAAPLWQSLKVMG